MDVLRPHKIFKKSIDNKIEVGYNIDKIKKGIPHKERKINMKLEDFLDVKKDSKKIELYLEETRVGIFSNSEFFEEYLDSKVLSFSSSATYLTVCVEKPRNLVNLGNEENWDNLIGSIAFLADGSPCRVIREELNVYYLLLNMKTFEIWDLESLSDDLFVDGAPEFFTKEDDPYYFGVEVR